MAMLPRERIRRRRRRPIEGAGRGGVDTPSEGGVPEAIAQKLAPPPNPYEVRCHHCDTSFAPGTKQCVHCGRRVGRAVPIVEVGPGPPIEGSDDEEFRPSAGRSAVWIVTAILMLIGSAMRACQ